MPKMMTVKLEVPSGSRPDKLKGWLNSQLNPHRMTVVEVTEDPSTPEQATMREIRD